MNKISVKDHLKRENSYKLENKKMLRKSVVYNLYIKNSLRIKISYKLFNDIKDHSIVFLNNRCVISGRKSKIGNLKFSRICFRRFARSCLISGIRKSC